LKDLSCARASLAQDPLSREQIPIAQDFFLRERVRRGAKDNKLIITEGRELELRIDEFAFDKPHVELKVLHLARDLFGVGDVERRARPGPLANEAGDERYNPIVPDRQRRTDPQQPAVPFARKGLLEGPRLFLEGLTSRAHGAPKFAQLEAFADAIE